MISLHNKLRRRDVNMVEKHKQVHVLTAGLTSIRYNTGLLMSTECMTGFTQEYLPLVGDYSRVATKCMAGFIHK